MRGRVKARVMPARRALLGTWALPTTEDHADPQAGLGVYGLAWLGVGVRVGARYP